MNTIINNDLVLLMDDGKVHFLWIKLEKALVITHIATKSSSPCLRPHLSMIVTQVGEFGSMHELVRDPNSRVYQLAQTQGVTISDE